MREIERGKGALQHVAAPLVPPPQEIHCLVVTIHHAQALRGSLYTSDGSEELLVVVVGGGGIMRKKKQEE